MVPPHMRQLAETKKGRAPFGARPNWSQGTNRFGRSHSVIRRGCRTDRLAGSYPGNGGTRITGSSCQIVQSPCGIPVLRRKAAGPAAAGSLASKLEDEAESHGRRAVMGHTVLKQERYRLSADAIGRLLAITIAGLELAWISALIWGAVRVGRWLFS